MRDDVGPSTFAADEDMVCSGGNNDVGIWCGNRSRRRSIPTMNWYLRERGIISNACVRGVSCRKVSVTTTGVKVIGGVLPTRGRELDGDARLIVPEAGIARMFRDLAISTSMKLIVEPVSMRVLKVEFRIRRRRQLAMTGVCKEGEGRESTSGADAPFPARQLSSGTDESHETEVARALTFFPLNPCFPFGDLASVDH